MKTIVRVTAASLAIALGACADDSATGADTGTGTGSDSGDDGVPTTMTTAPTTMTTMAMDDTSSDDGTPVDGSSSDDGTPVDGSSSDDGRPMDSSSSEGGEDSSSSDDGRPMDCGNGAIDAGEDCDGLALGGANCISIGMGFDGGTLTCAGDCSFDTSACTGGGGVPAEWTCNPDFYDEAAPNEYCDCSCGAHDPDCDVPNGGLYCDEVPAAPGTTCVDDVCEGGGGVPAEWTCSVDYYDDATWCDCSCGAHDPDCDIPGLPLYCEGAPSPAPAGTECVDDVCEDGGGGVPAEWTCNPNYYDALDGCDCSCGAHDPDCDAADQDLYCGGVIAPPGSVCENDVCVDGGGGGVPAAWYCDDTYYDDGEYCDCSCGAIDPDCDGTEIGLYCGAQPSTAGQTCTAGECSVPAGWTCNAGYYDDPPGGTQYCDCSCGAHDPDCDESVANTWCAGSPGNGQVCVNDVCQAP